jgi:hypothetical protein
MLPQRLRFRPPPSSSEILVFATEVAIYAYEELEEDNAYRAMSHPNFMQFERRYHPNEFVFNLFLLTRVPLVGLSRRHDDCNGLVVFLLFVSYIELTEIEGGPDQRLNLVRIARDFYVENRSFGLKYKDARDEFELERILREDFELIYGSNFF